MKLENNDNYDLVHVVDGKEHKVTSFDALPDKSILRFKQKELQKPKMIKSSGNLEKLLRSLQEDMNAMLSISDNDLKKLSDMKSGKFEKMFEPEFLHRVSMLSNQTLLIKQKQKAIAGIKGEWNQPSREHEFPDLDQCQSIGINLNFDLESQPFLSVLEIL